MRYIKVFLLVLLFFVVMMLFVQNQAQFSDAVTLKFDPMFAPAMESALNSSAPNLICAYIYELAGAANKFYHETPILKEEDEGLKAGYIALMGLTRRVLEQCIDILGFCAPEKM